MDAGFLKKLTGKAKGKAADAKDTAQAASMFGKMSKMNPFASKKKGPSAMDLLDSPKPRGPPTNPKATLSSGNSILSTAFKIVLLVISSFFIIVFLAFTIKKNQNFSTRSIVQIVLVYLIANLLIFGAYYFQISMLDFLISSKINIFCFYMILTYSSLTALFDDGFLKSLLKGFRFFRDLFKNPLSMFENGGKVFIPIFFFIVPSLVLLYNATKGIYQFVLVLCLTFTTGIVILLPNKLWPV